jgi:hypothetical protein
MTGGKSMSDFAIEGMTVEEAYRHINEELIPEVLDKFVAKQADYSGGEGFLFLGSKGQFSDMNRKFWKLYRGIWEDTPLRDESLEEVVEDFIGHSFLLLFCLRKEAREGTQRGAS